MINFMVRAVLYLPKISKDKTEFLNALHPTSPVNIQLLNFDATYPNVASDATYLRLNS